MNTKTDSLHIDGMSCGHCVKAVQQALAAIEGVTVHTVSIGSAEISYDVDAVPRARIADAVEDVGYMVQAHA